MKSYWLAVVVLTFHAEGTLQTATLNIITSTDVGMTRKTLDDVVHMAWSRLDEEGLTYERKGDYISNISYMGQMTEEMFNDQTE